MLNVLRGFKRNQGLLLSGSMAYYTLLSIVPMLTLTLVVLSHFVKEQYLFETLTTHLEMIIPGYADKLTSEILVFIKSRKVIGIVGFLVMLFFSSIAFTVLENAMSVIFFHRVRVKRRHFLISAVIPYIYIVLLGLGILLVSFIAGAVQTLEAKELVVFGLTLKIKWSTGLILYVLGVFGEILMLTSLYLVMPVGRITFRHALLGGITATVLWEITRHVLVWYYSTLSFINLIYGSLAALVIALLSIEAASIIILLGAQVIAEFERSSEDVKDTKNSGFET
jgi:YihY family inner membrane protein